MKPFAFVFPGQGSQAVGMLDVWGDNAAVRQTLEEASSALGEDIGRLIHEGPKERLDLTANTQPAMLAAGVACYRAWLAETGAVPEVVAGHSLGEYTAQVAADALSLAEAMPMVRFRAEARWRRSSASMRRRSLPAAPRPAKPPARWSPRPTSTIRGRP